MQRLHLCITSMNLLCSPMTDRYGAIYHHLLIEKLHCNENSNIFKHVKRKYKKPPRMFAHCNLFNDKFKVTTTITTIIYLITLSSEIASARSKNERALKLQL